MTFIYCFDYWLWFDAWLEEDVEFDQSPFTPAVVVFVFEYNVDSFEPGVVVFVLPLPAVVSAWEKAGAVVDEKNIAPVIVTDKINPMLILVLLLLINITTSYRYITAFNYAVCTEKVKILPLV